MKKKNFGRLRSFICLFLLMTLSFVTVQATLSPNSSLSNNKIGLSSTDGNGTWVPNLAAISCEDVAVKSTSTLSITNNYTSAAVLTFDINGTLVAYGATGSNRTSSITVSKGTTQLYSDSVSGKFLSTNTTEYSHSFRDGEEITLEAGETVTISLLRSSNNSSSASAYITNIALTQKQTVDVSFKASSVDYTISYYQQSTDTEASTATVASTVTGATGLSGEKSSGFVLAASGNYYCIGANYVDTNNQTGFLPAANGKLMPEAGYVLTPIFIYDSNGIAPFAVDGASYYTWETAFTAASTSTNRTVVVTDDYTLPAATDSDVLSRNGLTGSGTFVVVDGEEITYRIPAGYTLLLPYAADQLAVSGITAEDDDFDNANVGFAFGVKPPLTPATSVLHEFNIPVTATVDVEDGTVTNCGRVIVGGIIGGSEGSYSYTGGTYGSHSNLEVDGDLNLGDYAVLSATGYVLGDGNITAEGTGAKLYQPMIINDWRGAGAATLFVKSTLNNPASMIQSGESQIMPFIQWGTFNIRADVTMKAGNLMYLYCSLTENGEAYCSQPVLVGDSSNAGLLTLNAGATMASTYNEITWPSTSKVSAFPGKTTVSVSGGASFGELSLTVSLAAGSLSIKTSDMTMYLPYNYDIELKNGAYVINQSMMILPGVNITVDTDATLTIGSDGDSVLFMVLDGLTHRGIQSNSSVISGPLSSFNKAYAENTRSDARNYPTTQEMQAAQINGNPLGGDAEFVINGQLVIGANASVGGLVQTDGSGIVVVEGTAEEKVSARAQVGFVGGKLIAMTHYRYFTGMSLYDMTAKLVDYDTGEITDLLRGKTYYGTEHSRNQAGYGFIYYPEVKGTTVTAPVYVGITPGEGDSYSATANAHPLNETIIGAWTTEAPVLIIDGETKIGYKTLAEAMNAYQGVGNTAYIQLNDLSPVFKDNGQLEGNATLTADTYLNLNGCTIKGDITANGYKLYGIDTTTNAYTATAGTAGKIIGEVSGVQSFTTTDRVADVDRSYVAVTTGSGSNKTTSFYRVSVAVTGVQFAEDSEGNKYMVFRGGIRGNDEAILADVDAGFSVDGTEAWHNVEIKKLDDADNEGTYTYIDVAGIKAALNNDLGFEFYHGVSGVPKTVKALVKLNSVELESQPVSRVSFDEAEKTVTLTFEEVFNQRMSSN